MSNYECRLVGTDIADFVEPSEWEEVGADSPKEAVKIVATSYEIENQWTDVCSYVTGEVKVSEFGEETYRFRIYAKDIAKEAVDNR